MKESIKCDHCHAVGLRREGCLAPEDWLLLEAQDEGGEITLVYACGAICALAQWKRGPAKYDPCASSHKFTEAPAAFPALAVSELEAHVDLALSILEGTATPKG